MDEHDIIIEEWRWIEGYDNYEVSSLGRVRTRRILNQTDSNGYLYVGLSGDGKQKRQTVHVLVAEAFHGDRPDKMDCCHINGDRSDNRAENLEWGTRSDNIKARWKHHRERMDEAEIILRDMAAAPPLSTTNTQEMARMVLRVLKMDDGT